MPFFQKIPAIHPGTEKREDAAQPAAWRDVERNAALFREKCFGQRKAANQQAFRKTTRFGICLDFTAQKGINQPIYCMKRINYRYAQEKMSFVSQNRKNVLFVKILVDIFLDGW